MKYFKYFKYSNTYIIVCKSFTLLYCVKWFAKINHIKLSSSSSVYLVRKMQHSSEHLCSQKAKHTNTVIVKQKYKANVVGLNALQLESLFRQKIGDVQQA